MRLPIADPHRLGERSKVLPASESSRTASGRSPPNPGASAIASPRGAHFWLTGGSKLAEAKQRDMAVYLNQMRSQRGGLVMA